CPGACAPPPAPSVPGYFQPYRSLLDSPRRDLRSVPGACQDPEERRGLRIYKLYHEKGDLSRHLALKYQWLSLEIPRLGFQRQKETRNSRIDPSGDELQNP